MRIEHLTIFEPTVERYRQFLLAELRRMEEEALVDLGPYARMYDSEVEQARRGLLECQQPLLDELTRIYQIHARTCLIVKPALTTPT